MWLSDYNWLQQYKLFPNAGGLLDQEARFLEVVALLDNERTKLEKWKADGGS